ncbi:hypothetical protein GALL_431870 [mine drainage metagenome]|uniref:FUSC family protein n=1 Tax=mine drainage metagenome TaxID=410659 RepID=A0A1J5QGP3_9ZZZZ
MPGPTPHLRPDSGRSRTRSVFTHLPTFGDLRRLAPHDESHWVARRVGLSVGIPLAVLTATRHEKWFIFATFGALTAVFGRGDGYRLRLQTQAAAASAQVLAVVLGTAVAASGAGVWAAVVAAAAALAREAVGWRPAGPMFAVFAVSTTATIPATARDITPALLVSGSVAVLSMLMGLTGRFSSSRRNLPRGRSMIPGSPSAVLRDRPALMRPTRYALAVLCAGASR